MISAALADEDLLAPAFVGDSWALWRAILRAAEGLPLDDGQRAAFTVIAEREPPVKRVRELWIIAGRRAGKDSVASAVATVAAMGDYSAHLRPGERATVMCLACDRDQAKIVHRYIAGYFQTIPLLQPMVQRETADGLELSNGVEVVISTNSFRAVRGRTIVCVIFDEVAFWRDEDSASPDFETYNAVTPGLVTLPGAMLIGISTPHKRSGLLFERFRSCYGKPDPEVLVVKGPSLAFNPLLPQSVIDQALARDPEAAGAEWLGQWRSDLADFVGREVVDGAIAPGRYELPPMAGVSYVAFVDPSGGSSDSFTLAVAHRDRTGRGILDVIREVRPPFSPEGVVEEFAELLKRYGVSAVKGDRYAGEWPREQFRKNGIEYITSDKNKSDIYRELLPLLNGGKVELLDNARLVSQLCSLERRTARGGRDSIDHPRGSHDDLANSVAGALVAVAAETAPALWHRAALLADGAPVLLPAVCQHVYATAAMGLQGQLAVCFWADVRAWPGPDLILLDVDVAALSPGAFDGIMARLAGLAERCRARMRPPVLWAAAEIAQMARQRGGLRARKLDDHLDLRDLAGLALRAAGHIAAGRVKIADAVAEKAQIIPLGSILDAGGDEVDPLRIAAILGIVATLDNARSLRAAA